MTALLDHLASTPAMSAIWDDQARLQAMLDVEAALSEAEAALGIVPVSSVEPIRAACRAELYDVATLASEAGQAGNLAIPLVKALTRRVAATDAEAARFVHWGATSQDIQDSGTALQVQRAAPLLLRSLDGLREHLADHAREHANLVLAGRTWMQQALPVTFGLKAASWLSAVGTVRSGFAAAAAAAAAAQFGGAVGTLASLGEQGPAVAAGLARALGLALPALPWHTDRTRIAALGAALGLVCGVAGKIARDLALLSQTEIGEAFEPKGFGKGGSSTMPHKRNPVGCALALSAAIEAPPLVATLFAALVQEHERGLGGWHAEWEALPALFRRAACSASAMKEAMGGLELDPRSMARNLAATGGLPLAEAISMALAPYIGKSGAHALVERASRVAVATRRDLASVLRGMPEVSNHLTDDRIDALMRPENYLGSAGHFIASALAVDQAIPKL